MFTEVLRRSGVEHGCECVFGDRAGSKFGDDQLQELRCARLTGKLSLSLLPPEHDSLVGCRVGPADQRRRPLVLGLRQPKRAERSSDDRE
jgi:hypothetical protein